MKRLNEEELKDFEGGSWFCAIELITWGMAIGAAVASGGAGAVLIVLTSVGLANCIDEAINTYV